MPAGVRITFRSDTTMVAGKVADADPESSPLDLCCDGQLEGTIELAGQNSFRIDDLPQGPKQIELWLPIHRLSSVVNPTEHAARDTTRKVQQ